MIRLLVAAAIVVAAGLVAVVMARRGRSGPGGFGDYPAQVDPASVGLPAGGVVVFVDPTCQSCARVLQIVAASGRPYTVIEDPARFGVKDVPTTVVIDATGDVQRGWVGPLPGGAL